MKLSLPLGVPVFFKFYFNVFSVIFYLAFFHAIKYFPTPLLLFVFLLSSCMFNNFFPLISYCGQPSKIKMLWSLKSVTMLSCMTEGILQLELRLWTFRQGEYLRLLPGPNVITWNLQSARGRQKHRSQRCDWEGLASLLLALKMEDWGRIPRNAGSLWNPGMALSWKPKRKWGSQNYYCKETGTYAPYSLHEGMQPCWYLNFSSVSLKAENQSSPLDLWNCNIMNLCCFRHWAYCHML